MPVPTLPIDLLLYALCPLFRLHGKDSDETGANKGYRLLQLCRLTQHQKERATEVMRHRAFEFKREVGQFAVDADQRANQNTGFATNMLGHSVRHCMRLMESVRPPPLPPLILDTGIIRRMGRDWNISVLVASILRNARPPTRVVVFTAEARSAQSMAGLIHDRVDRKDDVLQFANNQIVMRTLNRVSVKSWNCKRGGKADLVIVNDAHYMAESALRNSILPAVGTTSIYVVGASDGHFDYRSELPSAIPGAIIACIAARTF